MISLDGSARLHSLRPETVWPAATRISEAQLHPEINVFIVAYATFCHGAVRVIGGAGAFGAVESKLYLNRVHLLTKFGSSLAIAWPKLAANRRHQIS